MSTASGAAAEHLPSYIAIPGQTDTLFVVVAVFMLLAVFSVGVFYFKLHALPEHMAHANNRGQYQLVAILGLLALFTHNNLFWIAALLLAAIQLPDVMGQLTRVADALDRIAGSSPQSPDAAPPPPRPAADAAETGAGD